MSVYRPARAFLNAALAAAAFAALSAWCGIKWPWAFFPAALFAFASGGLYYLGSRPSIRVSDSDLSVGGETLLWDEIRRVDAAGWTTPLVLHFTLEDERRIRVIYPGDPESVARFARQIRRRAGAALTEGGSTTTHAPARLLSEEDQAEVERLFHQLREAGRMDVAGGDE